MHQVKKISFIIQAFFLYGIVELSSLQCLHRTISLLSVRISWYKFVSNNLWKIIFFISTIEIIGFKLLLEEKHSLLNTLRANKVCTLFSKYGWS